MHGPHRVLPVLTHSFPTRRASYLFLGNIREVDAIVHVLRCFENDDIQHVDNHVDPIADAETVETELMLADLESLEKRVPNLVKKGQQGDKEAKAAAAVLGQALDLLRERSEEHTSELQSLMRISYAAFCLKKKIIDYTRVVESLC